MLEKNVDDYYENDEDYEFPPSAGDIVELENTK
jgi:hypothetical protein